MSAGGQDGQSAEEERDLGTNVKAVEVLSVSEQHINELVRINVLSDHDVAVVNCENSKKDTSVSNKDGGDEQSTWTDSCNSGEWS